MSPSTVALPDLHTMLIRMVRRHLTVGQIMSAIGRARRSHGLPTKYEHAPFAAGVAHLARILTLRRRRNHYHDVFSNAAFLCAYVRCCRRMYSSLVNSRSGATEALDGVADG